MSTRSIKALVNTTIDAETYDVNRVARLIESLEPYQTKVDNIINAIGDLPDIVDDVNAMKVEIDDIQSDVSGIIVNMSDMQSDISGVVRDISLVRVDIQNIYYQFTLLPTDITEIVSDVNTLQSDMSSAKVSISSLTFDMSAAKNDIADLSYTISLLPTDVTSIISDINTLEGIVDDLSSVVYPVQMQGAVTANRVNDLSNSVYALDSVTVKTNTPQTITGLKTFSNIAVFGNTLPALSTTNAAVVISGGVGISANAYVGGYLEVTGNADIAQNTFLRGNLYQSENNTSIIQSGTGTNYLKNTSITELTVTSINGITDAQLQNINSRMTFDLVFQGGVPQNSSTEISTTFQQILNQYYAAGYRQFYLPRGTYIVQNIVLAEGTYITGDGDETILQLPNAYNIQFPQTQNAVFTISAPNVTIKNIKINGNRDTIMFAGDTTGYQYEGIALDSSANYTTIERVYIENTFNDGIDMDNVNNCIIRNSWFKNCGGHGIHLNGEGTGTYNCVNNIIDNCIIENCGTVSFLGETFAGISCNNKASHNTISNVTVLNCPNGGVFNSGINNNWTNLIIRNNTPGAYGILIETTSTCTNIDTAILQNCTIGVDCRGTRNILSTIQMDTIAGSALLVTGNGNTLTNISMSNLSGSPLLAYGSNTNLNDFYINNVPLAMEVYGTNNMLSNFAIRNATRRLVVSSLRSSYTNFHWIDSDFTIVDANVIYLLAGSSYNAFSNINYSGNRPIGFESTFNCLYNRFLNGFVAAGFNANALSALNYTYIVGFNTGSEIVNMMRGHLDLGANFDLRQSGTGIIDQSGTIGVNKLKGTSITGNLAINSSTAGIQMSSIDASNRRLHLKTNAANNDYNTIVDAGDTVIAGFNGTGTTSALTLTTDYSGTSLGVRIVNDAVKLIAPGQITIDASSLIINGKPFFQVDDVEANLSQIILDISALLLDVSDIRQDISAIYVDISNINSKFPELIIDVSNLKAAETQNVKITGTQDISGTKRFTEFLRATNTLDASSTTTGAFVVAGGAGIAKNIYIGGNVNLDTGNLLQTGISIINQPLSGTGTNLLKSTRMQAQLDMSNNSIVNTGTLLNTQQNITIQPKEKFIVNNAGTTFPVAIYPNTPASSATAIKNIVMHLESAPYSAGTYLEQFPTGNILAQSINAPYIGPRVNSIAGGMVRLDTRPGNPFFQVTTYKENTENELLSFAIDSSGITHVLSNASSSSSSDGALIVDGGVGIAENLYVNQRIVSESTENATSSQTGALRVAGGVGIGGNTHVGGKITIYDTSDASSSTTGALLVAGGAAIQKKLYIGGNTHLLSNAFVSGNLTIQNTLDTTSSTSGAFVVAGGIGIAKNAYIKGTTVVESTTNSTNESDGAFQVKGGASISQNLYVGKDTYIRGILEASGNITAKSSISITKDLDVLGIMYAKSTTNSASTSNGSLVVSGGVGIKENTNIGGILRVYNATEAQSQLTGALIVEGGAGINKKLHVGDQILGKSLAATINNKDNGALIVSGGVAVGGNIFVENIIRTKASTNNKKIVLYDNNENDAADTATAFFGFGVNNGALRYQANATTDIHTFYSSTENGIVQAGNLVLEKTIASTSTGTGTLIVKGGVGIAGTTYIGGKAIVQSTAPALDSATDAALVVNGGIGVGGNIYVANLMRSSATLANKKVVVFDSSVNETASTATRFYGFGVNSNAFRYQTDSENAIHRFYSGTINGTLHAGNILLDTVNNAASTSSGTLRVAGGAGIGGNLYVGSNIVGYGNIEITNLVKTSNTLQNKKFVLYDISNTNPATATDFYGFGVSAGTLRYQTDSTNAIHRFYSGASDGILVAGNLQLLGTNSSTTTATGAIIVGGGVGISENINVGGTGTIESTKVAGSTTNAAFVVKGGAGIGGDLHVGGAMYVSNTSNLAGAEFSGAVTFKNTTPSTNTNTGSVIVYGGVGIGQELNVFGNVTLQPNGNIALNNNGVIKQSGTDGQNLMRSIKMVGGLDMSSNEIIGITSLKSTGNISISHQHKTDISGETLVSIYTSKPPNASANTKNALLFDPNVISGIATEMNNGNALIVGINTAEFGTRTTSLQGAVARFDTRAGNPIFTINAANSGASTTLVALSIDSSYGTTLFGNTYVSNTTDSASLTSGALRVSGGASINSNLYVGGALVFSNTTSSTNTTSGAMTVAGGVGIGGAINVGKASVIQEQLSVRNAMGKMDTPVLITENASKKIQMYLDLSTNGLYNPLVKSGDNAIISGGAKDDGSTLFVGPWSDVSSGIYMTTNSVTIAPNTSILGKMNITSTEPTTTSTSGALVVAGGAYIAKNTVIDGSLNVAADSKFNGDATFAKTIKLFDNVSPFTRSSSISVSGTKLTIIPDFSGSELNIYNRNSANNLYASIISAATVTVINADEFYLRDTNGSAVTTNPQLRINISSGITNIQSRIIGSGENAPLRFISNVTSILGWDSAGRIHINTNTPVADAIMTVGGTGNVAIAAGTSASSTSTGALRVTGGVGIGGNLYVGGRFVTSTVDANIGVAEPAAVGDTSILIGDAYGMQFRMYSGYFNDTPSFFASATPLVVNGVSGGYATSIPTLTGGTNSLIATGTATAFSIEWYGFFRPHLGTGIYRLSLSSDDGAYLWIGDNAVSGFTTANALINNGGLHSFLDVSATISLVENTLYPMRIQYGNSSGTSDLRFRFKLNSEPDSSYVTGVANRAIFFPIDGTKPTSALPFSYNIENQRLSVGNVRLTSNAPTSSNTTGALVVSGGVGISGGVNIGGSVNIQSVLSISGETRLGGDLRQTNFNIYNEGFSIISQSGSGTNNMKSINITTAVSSDTTSTGSLIVNGGAGLNGNLCSLRVFVGEPTRKETSLDVNGNACIGNRSAVYPAFNASTNGAIRRTLNIIDRNASLKIAQYNNTSVPSIEIENWGDTSLNHIWRMDAGADMRYKYISGTNPSVVRDTLIIDPSFVSIPSTKNSTALGDGALVVSGGASVATNMFIGGQLNVGPTSNLAQTGTSVLQQSGTGTNQMKSIRVIDSTDSLSPTTGALIVDGGIGVAKNVYIGNKLSIASTEGGSNTTSQGALQVAGGAGIGGNLYVGGLHRVASSNNNKKIVVEDPSPNDAPASATNFYGFGANTAEVSLRYQTPTAGIHKFYAGSGSGSLDAGSLALTATTSSTTITSGALVVSGGVGISQNVNIGGNVSVGVDKQIVLSTDSGDNLMNSFVDLSDTVIAASNTTPNTSVLTLTTNANQGDVGMRITNQNVTLRAPASIDIDSLLRMQRLSENFTNVASVANAVTVNYANTSAAYYVTPNSTTNLTLNINGIPTTKSYCSYTLTFVTDTSTYKVYANAVNVNGSAVVLRYGLGSAHETINEVSIAIQQIVVLFTASSSTPAAVLTTVTGYI